jgi:hypothetical protein
MRLGILTIIVRWFIWKYWTEGGKEKLVIRPWKKPKYEINKIYLIFHCFQIYTRHYYLNLSAEMKRGNHKEHEYHPIPLFIKSNL